MFINMKDNKIKMGIGKRGYLAIGGIVAVVIVLGVLLVFGVGFGSAEEDVLLSPDEVLVAVCPYDSETSEVEVEILLESGECILPGDVNILIINLGERPKVPSVSEDVDKKCYTSARIEHTNPEDERAAPVYVGYLDGVGYYSSDGECVTSGPYVINRPDGHSGLVQNKMLADDKETHGEITSDKEGWKCWSDVSKRIDGSDDGGRVQESDCNTCKESDSVILGTSTSPPSGDDFRLKSCNFNDKEGYCVIKQKSSEKGDWVSSCLTDGIIIKRKTEHSVDRYAETFFGFGNVISGSIKYWESQGGINGVERDFSNEDDLGLVWCYKSYSSMLKNSKMPRHPEDDPSVTFWDSVRNGLEAYKEKTGYSDGDGTCSDFISKFDSANV